MDDGQHHTLSARYLAGFAVILSASTRRLLILRSRLEGQIWKLPGGTIEPGEDPVSGVKREIAEELDCLLRVGATLITRFERTSESAGVTAVLYAPTLVPAEFAPRLSAEHDMHRWVPLDRLAGYEIDSYLDQAALGRFLAGVAEFCSSDFAGTLLEARSGDRIAR